jgi:Protein of unknown function (DUF3108)
MNDYSYKPSRNTSLLGLVLILVGFAHVALMVGADSVLKSIQSSLLGRKVITVEIFSENRGKTNPPATKPVKPNIAPTKTPKNSDKPQRPVQRNTPAPDIKPIIESNSARESELKPAANDATSTSNGQVPETDLAAITVAENDFKKQVTVPSENTPTDTVSNQSVAPSASDIPKIDLPKVGVLKSPQNYVFEVFQGEASEAKSVGRINFDLEITNLTYQSKFAIRFNWVTRLIADDRIWTSQGRVDDTGLNPQKVIEQRGKRSPKVIVLDHETSVGKLAESVFPIQRGLQDRTSIIWQFSLLARSNAEKYARGTEFEFPLLVSSKMVASKWRSKLETIDVGGRKLEAIHFVRTDQRDNDVRFEFWLSSELDMSPVKLTISDGKGRKFDVVREKLS